jgi:hypothetical protein
MLVYAKDYGTALGYKLLPGRIKNSFLFCAHSENDYISNFWYSRVKKWCL